MRHIGQLFRVSDLNGFDILDRFDQQHLAVGQLAHGANRFGMPFMPDHDHLQPIVGMARRFDVDLADQWASGIDKHHLAFGRRRRNRLWHTVRGKDDGAVIGAFIQLFDKDRTFVTQIVDHKFVVNDLVAHIDRRPPFAQRHLDDLDRAIDTGAKSTRRSKVQGQSGFGHSRLPKSVPS